MSTTRKYILVADDDVEVARLMQRALLDDGFDCRVVFEGQAVLQETPHHRPDLIILDRLLPDTSGDKVLAALRGDPQTADIPVLLVSGLSAEGDEIDGLSIGADAYLAKPFSHDRLRAHVAALLRRELVGSKTTQRVVIESVRSREVQFDGVSHHLTSSEHTLLRGLAASHGYIVSSRQINELLDCVGTPSNTDVATLFSSLQAHLGEAGAYVHDLSPAGFAFCAPAGTRIRI